MSTPDIVAALAPIVEVFERLSVPYSVAGSVASSAHGVARATLDVDLVADLHVEHVDRLVAAISADYYVDRGAALDAIARRSMFNVVHLATMLKVDIYLLTSRRFDQESFRRRGQLPLDDREGARSYRLDTPEDTILHKLEWYRAGGEVSERQWNDVIGVLQVQLGALDLDYLNRWATELGVADLLERALEAARRGE
ncbi:MAG: hypothetical protein WEF50_17185 [Myxococcota bacterium]